MSILTKAEDYLTTKIEASIDIPGFSLLFSIYLLMIFAAIPHIFLVFYFFYLSIETLVFINILSCVFYMLCIKFIKSINANILIIAVTAEVLITTVVTVILIGSSSYIQWYAFVTMLPHFSFFNISKKIKIPLITMLCIALILLSISEHFIVPVFSQTDNWFLKLINIIIVLSGTIFSLGMDKFLKKITHSSQKKNIEELQEQAYFDPLTKLLNRRYAKIYFDSIVNGTTERRNICFTIIDIDDFKLINDRYGHDIGDQVLIALADTFNNSVRSTDYIFRWGGEEFVLVTNDANIDATYNIIDNIRKKIEESVFFFNKVEIKFTITAGCANLKDNDIAGAIKRCDENLYRGKKQGKNRVEK